MQQVNNMQQVPYCVPPYFFVARRCLPLAGLFLALMLAAAQVAAQQTTLVTITAVGTVASSGLVEVDEGEEIVFELTRTGDLDSALTVTVAINESQDADPVLEETAPFERTVIFSAGQSTVQLVVTTFSDLEFEEHKMVTAEVAPAEVAEGDSRYYAAGSPGLVSVLVLNDDFVTIDSDMLKVVAGTTINFILTRPGDALTSSLMVTVQIGEPRDRNPRNRVLRNPRNRVLVLDEDTVSFTRPVMFLADASTAQLAVPTVGGGDAFKLGTTVTAMVLAPNDSVLPRDGKYYNASPTPASVLVSAVRQFSLAFQSASGDDVLLLQLTSGQSTSVYLVFSTSDANDALKTGESVEVRLELASMPPGVSIDPETITFTSDSTRAKVTLSVSDEEDTPAPAGTFMLQVAEATLIRDSDKRRRIMPASQLAMPVEIEVRPDVDFILDLDDDDNIADDFNRAVENLAPGAIATTGTNLPVYILVPGIGAETAIDAAALLRSGFSPSLGACVVHLAANSVVSTSTLTLAPGDDCTILQRLAEDSRILLPPYRSVLYWVGLDDDDEVAKDAADALIQLGDPRLIYIAPPVGFRTSFWVYDRTNPEVVLPLGIGVEAMEDIPPSIALVLDLPVGGSIVLDLLVGDEYEYEYNPDLARMLTESTEIRITEVGDVMGRSVAFIAFLDGTGRPSDDGLVRELVGDETLFSLGNDRVTLVPPSDMEGLHDGPLPTSNMEGSDDGPFPANTPKIIDFEPGSDVTIYRYSSENRAFEMLRQASSVISVTIEASIGRVVIETLPEGTIPTVLTYPSTSSSIFEIVVSLASTEEVEVVTRTRNIRTFAVDLSPLSKEEAGAFTDDARTVTLTLVSDDEIEAGPYATHSGDGSSVFADADLFPALLPDMVGGVFDYVVTGEPSLEGGRAAVKIEFADDQEVDGLAYHVYQRQSDEEWGWAPFVVDDANRIYSAPKPCPALSASREAVVPERDRVYAWGLAHEGLGTDHRCVLVEFSDGGMNDADQTANAFAYSTGAFATDVVVVPVVPVVPVVVNGGGATDLFWLLALTLIVLLARLLVRQRGGWSRETGPG